MKQNTNNISSSAEENAPSNIIISDNSIEKQMNKNYKQYLKYQPNQTYDIQIPKELLDTIKNLIVDKIKDNNFDLITKFSLNQNGEYKNSIILGLKKSRPNFRININVDDYEILYFKSRTNMFPIEFESCLIYDLIDNVKKSNYS